MKQQYSVSLSFGSLVYLGGIIGLYGGFTSGLFSAAYLLFVKGAEWWVCLITPPIAALTYCIGTAIFAALAFPIYKKTIGNGTASHLTGSFQELPPE